MKIHFNENAPLPNGMQTILRQVVSAGLKMHPEYRKLSCELNLSIVTAQEITALNNDYRNKNTPTDVLSFPSNAIPLPQGKHKKPVLHLGDIAICLSVATAQAQEYGHTPERELAFLTAHGLLHLLGYDHETPQEEAQMIAMQKRILEWVGIGK